MCQAGGYGGFEGVVRTNSWLLGLSLVDVKAQRDLRRNLVERFLRDGCYQSCWGPMWGH